MRNRLGNLPAIGRRGIRAFLRRIVSRLAAVSMQDIRTFVQHSLLPGVLAVGLGLVVAREIVVGKWQYAAVAIFSVPALFVLQRRPFLYIPVWLLVTPFLLHTTSATSRQIYWVLYRFLPLLTLVAILLPSALAIGKRNLPKLGFPEWAMVGYAILSIVSILLTNPDRQANLYLFYDRFIVPMMLYLIIRLSNPDERMLRWLIPVVFFIALSQTGIGVISWFAPRALPAKYVDYENHRTIGTMINTNAYVTTLILVGFLVLHYGLQTSSKRMRLVSILIFLMTCYGVFISFSRAGWLAGILALVGLTAMYPKFILKLGLVIVPVFLLVAGLFLQNQLVWASERFMSNQSERSALSRVPVYAAAFRMFQIKPVFGWGYGNFDRFDRQFQMPTVGDVAGDNKDHASHNFFLSMVAEQGLLGILLFLSPVLYWLGQSIKNFSEFPRDGFWSRKILVILWMEILSHIVVYNFANMRVVFGLGLWWVTMGLIGHFVSSRKPAFVRELARMEPITRPQFGIQKREQA